MATLKRGRDIVFDSLDDDNHNDSDNDNPNDDEKTSSPKIKLKQTTEGGEEEVTLLKKTKKRLKVESNRLLGVDGIRRVYEEFPVICQFKGRGTEAKYLSNLIDRYKEWSFQLYPSFEYTEVLNRTHVISRDPSMRHAMDQLRREECDRRMRSHYGVVIPEEAYAQAQQEEDNAYSASTTMPEAAQSNYANNKTTGSNADGSNNTASLSDDMFLQAMLEFDQVAKTTASTGAAGTSASGDSGGSGSGSGSGGAGGAVDLSDSEEEEEFEVDVGVDTTSRPTEDDKDKEEKKEEQEEQEEKEEGSRGVLESLLALDSVEDSVQNQEEKRDSE